MIDISGITKHFGKQTVLQDIHLQIHSGEIFGLLGPSGAGKTTLIRLIVGALQANSGTIRIDGKQVPHFDLLKSIGFMPQNDALYPEISGQETLRFFGGLYGLSGIELKSAIEASLSLVDLTADAQKRVAHYSGGMRKRLSLAVALIHRPTLLVLDEPTVGIDPVLRRKIWQEFDRQRKHGKTLIITTHVMEEIKYCDRAGLIRDGKMIACGTLNDLQQQGGGNIENLFFTPSQIREIGGDIA